MDVFTYPGQQYCHQTKYCQDKACDTQFPQFLIVYPHDDQHRGDANNHPDQLPLDKVKRVVEFDVRGYRTGTKNHYQSNEHQQHNHQEKH